MANLSLWVGAGLLKNVPLISESLMRRCLYIYKSIAVLLTRFIRGICQHIVTFNKLYLNQISPIHTFLAVSVQARRIRSLNKINLKFRAKPLLCVPCDGVHYYFTRLCWRIDSYFQRANIQRDRSICAELLKQRFWPYR